ncbi:monovalent cation:proton antiporter-2 (CPA2) family protein [Chelatococcus sp. SYSU_G07232]|uniref:Monovalent cation:proton antiporter-2 (CPA2) family protein n=1 Tax=Chelatococcus albus TaxID=3047466 RepID=A0ABT7AKV5_9HYPH|nr:monovalent cation:proton antiporter-2 (CPA2) family protein [Chelatococcus sp. SYSU_G07232]MDJ1160008.1 monovalent cation:proton antiporter-2 (CPA2) family protein [Chelatococcus sp. SYSU_G07232]
MAEPVSQASFLSPVLMFCAAAVVAVPLFRRIGLGAVLGYLAAGVVIGPSVLALVDDPETVRGVAEIGVVLLLFIVGLELKPSRLVAMRHDIFGLGLAQVVATAMVLAGLTAAFSEQDKGLFVIGVAFALSATSVALQILEERGDLQASYGRRAFAVLLFQDLAIVPLLAMLPLLANTQALAGGEAMSRGLGAVAEALGAVGLTVFAGRYLLNPFFRVLAATGAREVMTAAALLVALGAAMLMEEVGLSMAMGAFLAGVLLAESNFRHQLEADIEPFRGLLLGLFFMSVGMSIDVGLVAGNARLLALAVPLLVALKIGLGAGLLRAFGSPWRDAVRAGALLAPAGEFAFVLLPVAAAVGLVTQEELQLLTALAALSMLLGPIVAKLLDQVLERVPEAEREAEAEAFAGGASNVVVIGFGRFGQVVNQVLLADGADVTVIDRNVERIRAAARFGFKVYYGDGTRLDVLRTSGAGRADLVCICVDDRATALKIVELMHVEFPQVRTYVRAYDRVHAIDLMNAEVDYQMRETFESALAFGRATLEGLGVPAERARAVVDDVRRRDVARLMMQKAEGIMGGADMLHGARERLTPEPLTAPKARTRALTAETEDLIADAGTSR